MVKFALQFSKGCQSIPIISSPLLPSVSRTGKHYFPFAFSLIFGFTSLPWNIKSVIFRWVVASLLGRLSLQSGITPLHQAELILLAAMWRLIVVMPLDVDYVGNCLEEAQEISGDFCQDAMGDGAFKQRRWREGIQPDWAGANQWESKPCQRSLHTSYICFQGPVNQLWILQWTRIVQT